MAGKKHGKDVLNHTLLVLLRLLHENGIKNWFIEYGTLLGIVRDRSCIEGDDDVDIVVCQSQRSALKEMLKKNGFQLKIDRPTILKTSDTPEYASIDFYLATIDNEGNFHEKHDNIFWTRCYKSPTQRDLLNIEWAGEKVFIPNNYEEKLKNHYGDWQIPQNKKGKRNSKL
ncbi:MAG: hypothetical protein CMM15_05715 [Rhodospirillaceae bacterium]|nr:hypothetical protein [Rhodospirillaceae bacterium]